jgi:6-pyruvoyltetrahydropterin/6-carboxytetrahydropterin synthase
MFFAGVRAHFDAAHFIRGHQGKCCRLHGHRWEVEAVAGGQDTDALGMLADFSLIRGALNEILEQYDHQSLNDIPPFDGINPTAENLARVIYGQMKEKLGQMEGAGGIFLDEVKVYESPGCWASWRER